MSKPKRKSKTSTKDPTSTPKKSLENIKLPCLKILVKEIGNLPNPLIGQTNYTLKISSTFEGASVQVVNNKPLYPCLDKVTHKIDWEWHLNLPMLKHLDDFINLSGHFIIVQLFEEVEASESPSEPLENLPKLTELGSTLIKLEDILRNPNCIAKTQVFYGDEVIPLKFTWTNSPFIKFKLLLEDSPIPKEFTESTILEIAFDSIVNFPINENENGFLLEIAMPYSNDKKLFFKTNFEAAAEKTVYKTFSRLANYPGNIKYTKVLVDRKEGFQDFQPSSNIRIRTKYEENRCIPQNTYQQFIIPTSVLRTICGQELISLQLHLLPNSITKLSKKQIFTGTFNLNTFLENKITTQKLIVPLSASVPLTDKEGFSSCVLLEFKLSSHISKEPFIDPQLEIEAAKLSEEKTICEQNISKYLRMKVLDYVQNYQKKIKLKHLRQSEDLTNLKVFDSFYLYNEKHFLTAAVNYCSVNRVKYGNFRDPEVRKKCYIDMCDFTTETLYKLDERSPLPDPCPKELFELGYRDEANQIYIMKMVKTSSKQTKPFIDYAIYNLLVLDPVKANECCNRAVEIEPDMPIAKLMQSYIHFIFHEYREAEEILVFLTKKEQHFTEAWYALYIIFYQLNKIQELNFVEEGLFLASEKPFSPYQAESVLWNPRKTNDPKINCIQSFIQWGCIGYAELALSFLLTKYGLDSFEYSYHMAIVNYYKGDYQLAIKRLLFFGSDWQQRIAIKLKVHCLLDINNSKALEYLREIPRCHDRNNNLIYLKVAKFYLEQKKFKTARYYAKKCCLKYQSYSAFKLLAMSSYKCKDCAATEMCCKVLYEMNPHNLYSFCALGGLFARDDHAPQRIYCAEQCHYLKEQQDSQELGYIKHDLMMLLNK